MRWLLLLPLLVGCTQLDQPRVEQSLNQYAQLVSSEGALETVLTGSALDSARQSANLLQELQISQTGLARFELTKASDGLAAGCVDLSEVRFISSDGEYLPSQQQRVVFSARYTTAFLISDLEVGEQPC